MRKVQFLIYTGLTLACSKSQPTERPKYNEFKRSYYSVGLVYGDVEKIYETEEDKNDTSEYRFTGNNQTVEYYKNRKLIERNYYDTDGQLDSSVTQEDTLWYYKPPFKQTELEPTLREVSDYTLVYDTVKRTVDYYYKKKISMTKYLDSLNRVNRSYSHELKGFGFYVYNDLGYLVEEYFNFDGSTERVRSTTYSYVYDDHGNWIVRDMEIKYNGETSSRFKSFRVISYRH